MKKTKFVVLAVASFLMVSCAGDTISVIDSTLINVVDSTSINVIDSTTINPVAPEPDSVNVNDITINKGESELINVNFVPSDAYHKYAFSVPIDRQSEIVIKNGLVTGLKANALPVPVTLYCPGNEDLTATFNVKVNGYFDSVDGSVYAFNRMGTFDYPTPSNSNDVAATGWNVTKNSLEAVNTYTLSHFDLEEEARDPNSTRWAPRYAVPQIERNNVKIFDQFEFDYTFTHTLQNVPVGTWYFSVFMEGNNVQAIWDITGLETISSPVASSPSWYYQELVLSEVTTVTYTLRLIGETTNPDDSKTSPWIFFDSIRAVNEFAVVYSDDKPQTNDTVSYTNYVKDGNMGENPTNRPLQTLSESKWKVGNNHRTSLINLPNTELDIVSSDTNFDIDPNGKSMKFKSTVSNGQDKFSVYQDLTGIPYNYYELTLYAMGNPDNQTRENEYFRMFVTYNNLKGEEVTVYKNVRTESYMNGYIKNTLSGIEIVDGNARIGVDLYRNGSGSTTWGREGDCWWQLDDVSLIATNELEEKEIDIFNTNGLTTLLPANPENNVAGIGETGWTLASGDATLDIASGVGYVGTKAISVTSTGQTVATISQDISGLDVNKTYVLSTHLKSTGVFSAYVVADGHAGTVVSSSTSYLQSYVEITPSASTITLSIVIAFDAEAVVYLDWVIFADSSIRISVNDIVDIWTNEVVTPFVKFIPSSKAAPVNFTISSQSPANAFEVIGQTIKSNTAGSASIHVLHPESGAVADFTISAIDRPLLESISLANKEVSIGQVISTKLLLVTKTPDTAIMGDVVYSVEPGSESLVTLAGTRLTPIAAGLAVVRATTHAVDNSVVTTTFNINILSEVDFNTKTLLRNFNETAYNLDGFAAGGWNVISNSITAGSQNFSFTVQSVFGTSTQWTVGSAAVHNFVLEQTLTGVAAGTYKFTVNFRGGYGYNGTPSDVYFAGILSSDAALESAVTTPLNFTAKAAGTSVSTITLDSNGNLVVRISLTGTINNYWGAGIISGLSLEKVS